MKPYTPLPTYLPPFPTRHDMTYKVNLTKTPKAPTQDTMTSSSQPTKPIPTITDLPYGAVSAFTACRDCGKRFHQKDTTKRFKALANHYAWCNG